MKGFFAFALKIGISGLLLYLAFRSTDLTALLERIRQIDAIWAGAALALTIIQIALVAIRWHRIAALSGVTLNLRDAGRLTFIGAFFNQTLPSTVGGDAVRAWLLARLSGSWKNATFSVLADRAVGLFWLALLVTVCLPWSLQTIDNSLGRATLFSISLAGVGGVIALFLVIRVMGNILLRWRLTRHLVQLMIVLRRALIATRDSVLIGAISIVVHTLTVFTAWLIASSIGATISFGTAFILIPPVILLSAVPISVAGWGVRESAMIAAFSYAGLSPNDGLAISILLGACLFVASAIGGPVWIASGMRAERKPAQGAH